MFDLITHTTDSVAFLTEVHANFPDKVVMSENPDPADTTFVPAPVGVNITKTPTIRNATDTLSVVRCDAAELADIKTLTTIKILAEVPMGGDLLKIMTKANRTIYDGVHDQTPVAVLDDKGKPMKDTNGKAVMYTPPSLIGAFA